MISVDDALALIGLGAPAPAWPPRRLSLALQGGGSFGAFTWGASTACSMSQDVAFDAVSGVERRRGQRGAARLRADGGRAGAAKARLERFWRRMSAGGGASCRALRSPGSPFGLA